MLESPPFQKKQMPGAQQPMPGPQSPMQPAEEIDAVQEELAAPEEQAARDELMRHAYKLMADEQAFPQLQKMLEVDPENAIADATVTIIERLEQDMGQQDPEILQSLAEEIIPSISELADGFFPEHYDEYHSGETGREFTPEEIKAVEDADARLEQIAALAIGKWSEAHPDRVDQQGMQAIGNATLQAVGGGNGQPG